MHRNLILKSIIVLLLFCTIVFAITCTQPEVIRKTTLFAVGNRWNLAAEDGSQMAIEVSDIYDIGNETAYKFDILINGSSSGTSLLLDWNNAAGKVSFLGIFDEDVLKILPESVFIADLGNLAAMEQSQIGLWNISPVGTATVSAESTDYTAQEIDISYPERAGIDGYKVFITGSEGIVQIDYEDKSYILNSKTLLTEPDIPPISQSWGDPGAVEIVRDIYDSADSGAPFSDIQALISDADLTEENWQEFSSVIQNKSDIESPWIIFDGTNTYNITITAVTSSDEELGLNDLVKFDLIIRTDGTNGSYSVSGISLDRVSMINQ